MKKAQTQSTIITLILFFVVAVILIMLAGRVTDLLAESRSTEVCRASMLASSIVKINGIQALDIKCKMQVFDIKSDGVYRNQKKIEKFATVDVNAEVKRAVADRIAECWYMASEGKVNPFGEWSNDIIKKSNLCVLCSKINFDKSIIEKIGPQLNLSKWYNETKKTGKDITYYQYAPTKFGKPLDTSKEYYLVYSVASYSRWRTFLGWTAFAAGVGGVTIATGGTAGPVIAASLISGSSAGFYETFKDENPFIPSLWIVTSENVQHVCQKIAN